MPDPFTHRPSEPLVRTAGLAGRRGATVGIVFQKTMTALVDTKTCVTCGRTLPASEFRSGTLNVASDECTDCVWERMCVVRVRHFHGRCNRPGGSDTPEAKGAERLTGDHPGRAGDSRYRAIRSLGTRLALALGPRQLWARAEAGYVGFAVQLRKGRIRRHQAGGWHTPEDIGRLYDEQLGRCYYCGTRLDGRHDVDHKIPLGRGGTDWPENLCCVCRYCASHKKDRTEEEFVAYLSRLRRRPL